MNTASTLRNTLLTLTLGLGLLATAKPAHAEFQGDEYGIEVNFVASQTIVITGSRCSFYSSVLGECPTHYIGWQEAFWWWSVRAQAAVQNVAYSTFGNTVQGALNLKNNVDKKFNDNCHNAGEPVGEWLGRTITKISLENRNDSALILAAAEMRNINATASDYSQLLGYTNAVLDSVGAKQGTLSPPTC